MKKRTLIISSIVGILICLCTHTYAGFDDVLKEVLLETQRPIGGNDYTFHPGDEIIKKTDYSVHYSGFEMVGETRTLLVTVFEGAQSYVVKFPSPNIIQIKDVRIKVIAFDNTLLTLQLIKQQVQRYSS